MYAGLELSEDDLRRLKESAGQMSAKMRAVRIVSASNVSKRDLEQRLIRKGESAADARQATAWMEDLNLLDDGKTASQIVAQCASRGYGVARAKQMLYEKQIPKELWEAALADYPDQTDYIRSFLQSRLEDTSDQKEIRRATDALLRRGHLWRDIRRVLSAISEDSDSFLED